MKIILIGFMGSGKTSVAKKLGSLLKLPIVEMDGLVFQKTNTKDMHEVLAKGGEALLRETEITIAQQHDFAKKCIISTGGGVVLNEIILKNLKKDDATIIFLNASFATIVERLEDDLSRPLFKHKKEAEALYHMRYPLYVKHSDITIEVDGKTVETIAREVAEMSLRS